jgi:YHS domain-containing protein
MELDPGQVDAQSSYQGKEYDFCSDECRRLFDADPEQYVGTTPDVEPGAATGTAVSGGDDDRQPPAERDSPTLMDGVHLGGTIMP